jgi:hypothetical protein
MPRTITVGSIAPATGNTLTMQTGHVIRQPNVYINHWYVRDDTRTTYAANNSGNGTAITGVRLTITPRYSNSTIRLRWTLHGEGNENIGFLVHRGGSLIGFNTQRGNVRHSCIATCLYDQNVDSTPHLTTVDWYDRPGTASSIFYDVAVRSTGGSNYTYFHNRTSGSTGTGNHEIGISFGFAWEITADY